MRRILRGIGKTLDFIRRGIYKTLIMPIKKAQFAEVGKNVTIGRHGQFTYKNISIGDHTSIGANACFMSTRAKIVIGRHVMFGPHVFIITGNHKIDVVGRYMNTIKDEEKGPEDDQDVVIKDDVWIGTNAIILKGTTLGEGCVIAAGSVVISDVEPYSITGGVPAKKIKDRFTSEQILEHKKLLEAQNASEAKNAPSVQSESRL